MEYFDRFSAWFWEDKLLLDGILFPLGQITTDVLNLSDQIQAELQIRIDAFLPVGFNFLENRTPELAEEAQKRLDHFLDLALTLPPYCYLPIEQETSYHLFPMLLARRDRWAAAATPGTDGYARLPGFFERVRAFAGRIRYVRFQIAGVLDAYFEDLPRRCPEAYAQGYQHYFIAGLLANGGLFAQEEDFEQGFDATVRFVPLEHPGDQSKLVIAEETQFTEWQAFLYADFYRGLIKGHAPQRCHNCGRFFLLENGYDTCYCNRLAPGEEHRTCRIVGAHNKAKREKTSATPAQQEYAKVYNRLKARKNRKKISVDEWNDGVAYAFSLKEKAERGQLTDVQLRELFAQI